MLALVSAEENWNDAASTDLHGYVRSLSLDLRGRVPSGDELQSIEDHGGISSELLDAWLYSSEFEEEVVEQRKLSDAQKAEIKSIFVLYDANNNGLLEKKELFEALTASGYDDEEIEEMFEEYDQDGSHAIDFDEFCAMLESSYLDS